jgi:ketosteroid isomerase-like protein
MGRRFRPMSIFIVCILSASAAVTLFARTNASAQRDRIAIERLHQQDVDATLSGKADDFAKLWDSEAVRIGPGQPAEIGKAAIYATDKREEASGEGQSLCYKPEIQDLQITGDWAFEWGYFSFKQSANTKPMRGKVLRVIKRQPDGSWKFARVIGFTEKLDSAAPMSAPCE